eukprot:357000-Chlamydomonas_euryale.AAC.11
MTCGGKPPTHAPRQHRQPTRHRYVTVTFLVLIRKEGQSSVERKNSTLPQMLPSQKIASHARERKAATRCD